MCCLHQLHSLLPGLPQVRAVLLLQELMNKKDIIGDLFNQLRLSRQRWLNSRQPLATMDDEEAVNNTVAQLIMIMEQLDELIGGCLWIAVACRAAARGPCQACIRASCRLRCGGPLGTLLPRPAWSSCATMPDGDCTLLGSTGGSRPACLRRLQCTAWEVPSCVGMSGHVCGAQPGCTPAVALAMMHSCHELLITFVSHCW